MTNNKATFCFLIPTFSYLVLRSVIKNKIAEYPQAFYALALLREVPVDRHWHPRLLSVYCGPPVVLHAYVQSPGMVPIAHLQLYQPRVSQHAAWGKGISG